MKKEYEVPVIDVIVTDHDDIITMSDSSSSSSTHFGGSGHDSGGWT